MRVHQLLPESGTTDGQVPTYDAAQDLVLWDTPPSGGGGGGAAVIPVRSKRTAGHVSVTWTSFAAFDTSMDLTLPAADGDTIRFGLAYRSPYTTNAYILWDVASIDGSGTILSQFEGAASGDGVSPAFTAPPINTGETAVSATEFWDVDSSDLVSGNITLRLYVKRVNANRTVYANATSPVKFWAENLGQ